MKTILLCGKIEASLIQVQLHLNPWKTLSASVGIEPKDCDKS